MDYLKLPEGLTVEQALGVFRSDPAVIYAEPNYYYSATVMPSGDIFGLLWGLHNSGQTVDETEGTPDADIDAPEAWEITTGSSEVVVAVIDSGLDFSHPDLAGNVWGNPGEIAGNGLDDDGNGYIDDVRGWDFINGDNAPLANDTSGHGTHVAGTIAAAGAETTGMAGVSWKAKIMSLRTLDAGGAGDTATLITAFEYAETMGADIINCSWGGTSYSQALWDVIEISSALVVCAAGNSGSDTDIYPHYPAAYDNHNIISVAATDGDDGLAGSSNYGAASVDLGAPGVNIYSCAPGRRVLWSDDFDDGSLDGWNSGGPNNNWGLTGEESVSPPWSLADSPDGNYSQRTNSWIRSPMLNLAGERHIAFQFKIKGRSEASYDNLQVEVSTDGSNWFWKPVKLAGIGTVNGVSGTIAEWTEGRVDLGAYDGVTTLYIRFTFVTDWTNNYDGWYIDDVAVTAASSTYDGSEYRFMDGTSMAAPHVAGAAALVRAENPSLTSLDIKSILLGTVDLKPLLEGILVSGGRLNVYAALSALNSGVLEFDAALYRVQEKSGSVSISVIRTGGSDGEVSVTYDVTGGTATEWKDYMETTGLLVWADGETAPKTFSVGIIDDTELEVDETVEITLTASTGNTIVGSPSKVVVTIIDDDSTNTSSKGFSFWLKVLPAIIHGQ